MKQSAFTRGPSFAKPAHDGRGVSLSLLVGVALALVSGLAITGKAAAAPMSGSEIWRYDTGSAIWASPTFADHILYVANDGGELLAIDTRSRQPRWRFKAGGAIRSQPTIDSGRVFIASDDGYLYAVSVADGRELWRFDLESQGLCRREPSSKNAFYDYLQSSPVVDRGTVYVGASNGALYAVDATAGTMKWKTGTSDSIRGTPRIVDGRVYFGSWDDYVYAVDAATGKRVWRQDTGGIVQGTPAIAAGKLVIGSRSAKLFALDIATGKSAWAYEYKDSSWVESSATVDGTQLLIGSSDSLKLSSFDVATGRENWSFKTGGWTWATPTVAGETVYVGSISAEPYYFEGVTLSAGFDAVDKRTGALKWHFDPKPLKDGFITGGVMAAAVVAEKVVYVAALDGMVYALRE